MGTQNVYFVPRSWQDEKHLSLFLYRAQSLLSLTSYLQNIADLSTYAQYARRTSYELRNRPRSPWSLFLSGRTSERGIQRPEVRFLMETQNFFYIPRSWQDGKHLSVFLYRNKNLPSLLFYLHAIFLFLAPFFQFDIVNIHLYWSLI